MWKLFICLLFVESVYNAAVLNPPVEKPEEFECEEGCYNKELNMVLSYNVSYSPQDGKSCLEYLCQSDGWTQIFSCGALGVGPNCERVKGDLFKPYPECCDTVVCESSAPGGATATATASA